MCEFKNCAGAHACLLRKISPCPDSFAAEPKVAQTVGLLGLTGKGFLDRDDLIASLKLDNLRAESLLSAEGLAQFRGMVQARVAS